MCCARCGASMSGATAADSPIHGRSVGAATSGSDGAATDVQVAAHAVLSTPPAFDLVDWEFEEDLRAAERLLRSLRAAGVMESPRDPETTHRIDSAHAKLRGTHRSPAAGTEPRAPRAVRTRQLSRPRTTWLAWMLLSMGLMTFVCGGVLLGWSFASGRGELWALGMPLTLGGQAVLLLGLLFQLESLWQSNRDTTSTLDDLDAQLADLRHAATMLSTSRGNSAQSFYAHMAEGASPELLLADLKGQLDMLATRIASERY
jgi:hypothetical protein